jgi:non-ribosomal peptide synthase protein (TIGR01720 family)
MITGRIAEGRLQMRWTYAGEQYRQPTIERLAQEYLAALRTLIAHCRERSMPEAKKATEQ